VREAVTIESAKRFQDYAAGFVRPLLSPSKQRRPEVVGTGLLIEHNSAFYIASAAHVMNNFHSMWFHHIETELRPVSGLLELTRAFGDSSSADPLDIGVVRLAGGPMPPYSNWNALPSELLRAQPLPRAPEGYAFVGFPSSRSKANPADMVFKVSYAGINGMSTAPHKYEELCFSPENHLLFDVDRGKVMRDGQSWNFPSMHGISGSPIWHKDEAGVHIVGIAIEYHAKHNVLVATDIGVVIGLVRRLEKEVARRMGENSTQFD
jgi:hypothetical protein